MDAYVYFKIKCADCPYGFHDGLNCPADDCIAIENYLQAHFNMERAKVGNPHGFKGKVNCTAP